MRSSAVISECGKYRFQLTRNWWEEGKGLGTCLFVMLNPSNADADHDDPTIRRCIAFAKSWGYDELKVANLLPYRATDPMDLLEALLIGVDMQYMENLSHLGKLMYEAEIVICAWGNGSIVQPKKLDAIFFNLFKHPIYKDKLHYLELSKDGVPKHPLYLKGELTPKKF
ncbi:MAG: hypothetical protein C0424_10445 [Sphingobacteriaceae bacterium]|nr:hypothetical protein [Sphingobacteriaceae bacterium]